MRVIRYLKLETVKNEFGVASARARIERSDEEINNRTLFLDDDTVGALIASNERDRIEAIAGECSTE